MRCHFFRLCTHTENGAYDTANRVSKKRHSPPHGTLPKRICVLCALGPEPCVVRQIDRAPLAPVSHSLSRRHFLCLPSTPSRRLSAPGPRPRSAARYARARDRPCRFIRLESSAAFPRRPPRCARGAAGRLESRRLTRRAPLRRTVLTCSSRLLSSRTPARPAAAPPRAWWRARSPRHPPWRRACSSSATEPPTATRP